jgi:hypothetical protein
LTHTVFCPGQNVVNRNRKFKIPSVRRHQTADGVSRPPFQRRQSFSIVMVFSPFHITATSYTPRISSGISFRASSDHVEGRNPLNPSASMSWGGTGMSN